MRVPPADLRISDATVDDAAAVRALLTVTWHHTFDVILGAAQVTEITRRWHAPEALIRQVGEPLAPFLVAIVDDAIVGTASAALRDGRVVLTRLYVHPERQGLGIGARLLDAVLARFPVAGRVALEVHPANVRAIAFYERAGFVAVGRASVDGLESLTMERRRG